MFKEKKLISEVQMYPVLFKIQNINYNMRKDVWDKIAKKCGISSGFDACELWMKLINSYMEYLRDGHAFEFIKEMRFMQSYLISIQSDSDDLDEDELQRILDSDSETFCSNSVTAKRRKKTKPESQNEKRILTPSSNINSNSTSNVQSKSLIKSDKAQVNNNPTADSSSSASIELPTSTAAIPSNVSGLSSLQLIFLGYAKVLSEMPLQIQVVTKHKIAQIMNEAELNLLKTNDASKNNE